MADLLEIEPVLILMSDSKYIYDATPENFAELVFGNSMRGPVMVNFWSEKAGPCLKLWPLLEKLVNEYSGKFLLVNFNADKFQQFARNELAVNSVPTVKMYRHQQIVDVIHGAESERSFRDMINKHLPRASDPLMLDAVKLYQEEKSDAAFEQLKKLYQADADNQRIPLTLIKLMLRDGRFEEMLSFVSTLPSALKKNDELIGLVAHANFLLAANTAPEKSVLEKNIADNPADVASRYQLSALFLLDDEYQHALDQLLAIVKLDRSYKDDIAVKGMVSILNVIGSDTPLAKEYRQKMIDELSA
ncbi:MAG: tetratricopeptide repeat protein [Gammaproteobacteria bacterium]|nr:tetratricopeptide repeat protein [Gammaproteobacteria bacterium]